MIFKRILGVLFLLIGIATIAICVMGIRLGHQAVDNSTTQLKSSLSTTATSLDTVQDTLALTRNTVVQVNESLVTAEFSARDVAKAISDTRPLLADVQMLTGQDIPSSLDEVEMSIPDIVAVASAIDDTLDTLSRFQYGREISLGSLDLGPLGDVELPSFEIGFGLGIEYNPDKPFDESVMVIGDSLEGIPEQLRETAENLDVADENLDTISADILLVADDINAINANIAEIPALVDEYSIIVNDLQSSLRTARGQLDAQAAQLKTGITILLIWLGLTQLAPLYLGYELLTNGRQSKQDDDEADEPVTIVMQDEVLEEKEDEAVATTDETTPEG